MQIPLTKEDNEWWKVAVKERDNVNKVRKMPQSFDASQIFSIMMGLIDDSVPPELPQVEFTVLQNWMQIAVVLAKQSGDDVIKSYSAVIAYNGVMTEEKKGDCINS